MCEVKCWNAGKVRAGWCTGRWKTLSKRAIGLAAITLLEKCHATVVLHVVKRCGESLCVGLGSACQSGSHVRTGVRQSLWLSVVVTR